MPQLVMGSEEEDDPDLECAICFSHFNNVFRAPKMLQCRHTFCLECLARLNIISEIPNAIQCPMCRNQTTVPVAGLPKLDNNTAILSCFPEGMQKMYSIRFNRNKGRLYVKDLPKSMVTQICVRTISQSLNVSRHLPVLHGQAMEQLSWSSRSMYHCRTFLIIVGVIMIALLVSFIMLFLPHFSISSSIGSNHNLSADAVTSRKPGIGN